jgi:hypothetical protein
MALARAKRERDLFDIFPDLPWPYLKADRRAVIEQQVRDVPVKWAAARAKTNAAIRIRDQAMASRRVRAQRSA